MTKQNKMRCYICKKEIQNLAVCDAYIVHICEEGDEYECFGCFDKRKLEELNQERYLTKHLKRLVLKQDY